VTKRVVEERFLVAEHVGGADAHERESLGERDTDPHQHLQTAGELGLASDALDRLADDDAHADGGADGGETVTDGGDATRNLSENRHSMCFLPCVEYGGCRTRVGLVLFSQRELD